MRAPLTYHNALDIGSASRTGFSFPTVNSEVILIISATVHPIEARAVAVDGLLERVLDGFPERPQLRIVNLIGRI